MASVAYVDPGNFATNFAGGAALGYQLAWVIMAANLTALLVQYLTAKAGLATGASLPELCRAQVRPRGPTSSCGCRRRPLRWPPTWPSSSVPLWA